VPALARLLRLCQLKDLWSSSDQLNRLLAPGRVAQQLQLERVVTGKTEIIAKLTTVLEVEPAELVRVSVRRRPMTNG